MTTVKAFKEHHAITIVVMDLNWISKICSDRVIRDKTINEYNKSQMYELNC